MSGLLTGLPTDEVLRLLPHPVRSPPLKFAGRHTDAVGCSLHRERLIRNRSAAGRYLGVQRRPITHRFCHPRAVPRCGRIRRMFAEIPFTPAIAAAVDREWDAAGDPVRLQGGEESAAYRVADRVVRIGPTKRSVDEAEWCHAIAAAAAHQVPEIVAALPARSGGTVVVVDDHPISVWPLAEGRWLDLESPTERRLAARMLARLHVALKDVTPPPRPKLSFLDLHKPHPRLEDPQLDCWLKNLDRPAQALHGDYYRGNLLVLDGRINAVIDWDETWVGPPEVELAGAAREFGAHWDTDLTEAKLFIDDYLAEGGTAQPMDDEMLVQLIRHRLRAELTEFAPAELPADDDYHQRQLDLFERLRP